MAEKSDDRKPLSNVKYVNAQREIARQSGKPVYLPDFGPGSVGSLFLVINPKGRMHFELRRIPPRSTNARRYKVCAYPSTSVADARKQALELRVAIDGGNGPATRQAATMQPEPPQPIAPRLTLDDILHAYTDWSETPASWHAGKSTVRYVFKSLLAKPIDDLDLSDFLLAADGHASRSSASLAVRTIRPALRWAVSRKLAPACLVGTMKAATIEERQRIVGGDELGKVLVALRSMTRMRNYARAAQLMMWTLTRKQEVCQLIWSELDLDAGVWTLPKPYRHHVTGQIVKRTKNGQEHKIILPRQAIAMLREMRPVNAGPSDWVFPAARARDDEPVAFISNWSKFQELINVASGTSGWHRHDLRRSGATLLAQTTSADPHIIEAALNHIKIHSKLAATYNLHRYADEVGEGLQVIADWYDTICNRVMQSDNKKEEIKSSDAA